MTPRVKKLRTMLMSIVKHERRTRFPEGAMSIPSGAEARMALACAAFVRHWVFGHGVGTASPLSNGVVSITSCGSRAMRTTGLDPIQVGPQVPSCRSVVGWPSRMSPRFARVMATFKRR